ncbi:hypothetical protein [Microcystis aeruginosa]|uniref:hypothetical protein n=1 Tax=Microcystis aeruginosa TaxID=1126 RepID=UPI000A9F0F9E|nr:hypothetical protein [Microcystis aeruginosa]
MQPETLNLDITAPIQNRIGIFDKQADENQQPTKLCDGNPERDSIPLLLGNYSISCQGQLGLAE